MNGVRTHHDRNSWTNGVNGGVAKREGSPDKGKAHANMSGSSVMMNGGAASFMDVDSQPPGGSKFNDLPDEIQHITADIMSLSLLLTRLSQWTHAKLQDEIAYLASKTLPQGVLNGTTNHQSADNHDTSQESLEKKIHLLNFLQDMHSKWVKTLVITEWSKKAAQVGALIDIRVHLLTKQAHYQELFWELIRMKQDLHWAKVPGPDLKTALEVLTTGQASWMPELGYIEPPPITWEEKEAFIDNINTMLSVRLTFDEHEKLPAAFRDYNIANGRVTFKVKGEFEVDLTIGDEDFEQQFWFIDFRFLFTPAPAELSHGVRTFLENKVNTILGDQGLAGCYNYLHEFVLTQKIIEFRRQATELAMGRWVDTLKVEKLNRAMSIQYWLKPPHGLEGPSSQTAKSWILLGVWSGKGVEGDLDSKPSSYISLRWFRDNKEVKDFDIPLNVETISAEKLLTAVIASHVEYILTSISSKLLSKPRFAQKHARLDLEISKEEPQNSSVAVQLFDNDKAVIKIEPLTGFFTMFPRSPVFLKGQMKLNTSSNVAEEGANLMEQLRFDHTVKDLNSRVRSIGWFVCRPPITQEETKAIVYSDASGSREAFKAVWLRKANWMTRQWFVMISMSLGGDQWWLVDLSPPKPNFPAGRLRLFTKMPMTSNQLTLSDTFFRNLSVYAAGMISHITDLRKLHTLKKSHTALELPNHSLPPQVRLPTIYVRLSEMLQQRPGSSSRTLTWAKDFVPIIFKGVRSHTGDQEGPADATAVRRDTPARIRAEARLTVIDRNKFKSLRGNVDHDVVYNHRTGQFSLKLRADMGTPVVDLLTDRVQALERLMEFVEAIRLAGSNAIPQSVALREVVFTYSNDPAEPVVGPPQGPRAWNVHLDLPKDAKVVLTLEKGNPHIRALDMLQDMAQSTKTELLPSYLPFSLPLYRVLDRIEDEWESIAAKNAGNVAIVVKAAEWVTVRFTLPASTARRLLCLDIKTMGRKGRLLWHVKRTDEKGHERSLNAPQDEFDTLLQRSVWHAHGDGRKTFGTSAAADPKVGIETLLWSISESVKLLVGTLPPPPGTSPHPGGGTQDLQQGPQKTPQELVAAQAAQGMPPQRPKQQPPTPSQPQQQHRNVNQPQAQPQPQLHTQVQLQQAQVAQLQAQRQALARANNSSNNNNNTFVNRAHPGQPPQQRQSGPQTQAHQQQQRYQIQQQAQAMQRMQQQQQQQQQAAQQHAQQQGQGPQGQRPVHGQAGPQGVPQGQPGHGGGAGGGMGGKNAPVVVID